MPAPVVFPTADLVVDVTTHTHEGRTWLWNGTYWESMGTAQGLTGTQGLTGIQGITGDIAGISYANTATAGGTTALTSSSATTQVWTGTLNQTITLPDNGTLSRGHIFLIINDGTGTLTIQSSTAVSLATITSGIEVTFLSVGATNTAPDWDVKFGGFQGLTGTGANVAAVSPSITNLNLAAGTSALASLELATGVVLDTPLQGAVEWDGVNAFITGDTSTGSGRQINRHEQRVYLATGAAAITAGTDMFPSLRPAMLAGHLYHFKMYLKFTKTTAGTVTFQLRNSAAVNFTYISAIMTIVPQGGVFAIVTNIVQAHAAAAATASFGITGSLTAATHFGIVDGFCVPASDTRLSITPSAYGAGTITTVVGSNLVITDLGLATTATYGNVG